MEPMLAEIESNLMSEKASATGSNVRAKRKIWSWEPVSLSPQAVQEHLTNMKLII